VTIGFLSYSLSFLEDYKSTIAMHPECNYVFYGDTLHTPFANLSTTEREQALTDACTFLLRKNVELIVIDREIEGTLLVKILQKLEAPTVVVLHIVEFQTYVHAHPFTHTDGDTTQTRIVHLTQHNESTDAAIAQILGGFLIEE